MISPPVAATIRSAAALAEELERYRVVPANRLHDLLAISGPDAASFATLLVERGELTSFQVERALAGAAKTLVLGPYRVLGPHLTSTFGPIFFADKNGKAFALRMLPLRSLWQAKQARQLVRSLGSLANHPVIVPLVDADSANGFHYLAWPLVNGELLVDRVNSAGPLSVRETVVLLAHLSAALAACHARRIVQVLLTPHAIALTDELPRLLETGTGMLLAKNIAAEESLFDTMSTSSAIAGASDYAAPEWMADPTQPQAAGDQYSLGAVGYFALSGSPLPAVPGSSLSTAFLKSGKLRPILERLLQPDPASRFSGMDEVREVLEELAGIANEPAGETPPPVPDRPTQPEVDRAELSGDLAAWQAPPLSRPVERDESEASVHFDMPALEPEEIQNPPVAPAQPSASPRAQPAIAIRPDGWTPTPQVARPAPATPAPAVSPPRGSASKKKPIAPPPLLPAAPLIPDREARASGVWTGVPYTPATADDQPSGSILWKKMKRKVLFWQVKGDTVQASVFGPPEVRHSQAPNITVFLHAPSVSKSVATLARAFHHDAVLLGTCRLAGDIVRGSRLDVHIAVEHAAVTNPLAAFKWQGQPHRLTFELVIPWEAPLGNALAVISIGRENIRIGKVEFPMPILDRPSRMSLERIVNRDR
jgi:serine/threonine protein kinase